MPWPFTVHVKTGPLNNHNTRQCVEMAMAEDLQQGQLYKSSWRREVSGEVTGICGFSCCVNTMQLKTPKHPFATSCCVTSSELVTFLSLSHLYNRANTISWSERCRFRKITEGSAWAQKTLKFLSPSKHHWILTGNNRGMNDSPLWG